MHKYLYLLGLLSLLTNGPSAWPHGEDRPGPHGGIIRMPGAFHTEFKLKSNRIFEIYLLDMEWKNPTSSNSTVKASLKRAHQSDQEITCQTQDLVFLCELKKGKKFQVGDKVSITATRQGMSGNVALYSYPFQPPQVSASEEHKHHGTNH